LKRNPLRNKDDSFQSSDNVQNIAVIVSDEQKYVSEKCKIKMLIYNTVTEHFGKYVNI